MRVKEVIMGEIRKKKEYIKTLDNEYYIVHMDNYIRRLEAEIGKRGVEDAERWLKED